VTGIRLEQVDAIDLESLDGIVRIRTYPCARLMFTSTSPSSAVRNADTPPKIFPTRYPSMVEYYTQSVDQK
jgi:hypothetical protein